MDNLPEDIVIKKHESGAFTIVVGDKYADHLTYEEMLGLIATLCVNNRCLAWLRTEEQHQKRKNYFNSLKNGQ